MPDAWTGIAALAEEIGGIGRASTSPTPTRSLPRSRPDRVDVLVNNAGGARVRDGRRGRRGGLALDVETNVPGTLRMTKALLPALIASGDGRHRHRHLHRRPGAPRQRRRVHLGWARTGPLHRTLRLELLGQPVRLTEILPGMVETEFSVVRFDGDQERADAVYAGPTSVGGRRCRRGHLLVASRPPHVNLDEIVIKPRDQANARRNIKTGYGAAALAGVWFRWKSPRRAV